MTEIKIVCPKCGSKAETLHYVPVDGKNEVFMTICSKCKHHSKEWRLAKDDAIDDFLGKPEDETFAIVPLGTSIIGCELYAKIHGNSELIPYKKDSLNDILTEAFKKRINLEIPTKNKVESAFTVIESFFNEYVGEEGRKNLFNAFLQFKKDTEGGQDESGRND